jgi:integrase
MVHAARDLVAGVLVAEAARRKGVARSTLQRFTHADLAVAGPIPGVYAVAVNIAVLSENSSRRDSRTTCGAETAFTVSPSVGMLASSDASHDTAVPPCDAHAHAQRADGAQGVVLAGEVRVLKELLAADTGRARMISTPDQRRRLALKGKALTPEDCKACCQIVRPETILAWFRHLSAKKYDSSRRRRMPSKPRKAPGSARAVIHTVFSRAARAQLWMGTNPAQGVEPRRVPRRAYATLRAEEVPILLPHVPEEWRGVMAAALYTGMRKGEILGLQKCDVDLEHGSILVARSYDRDTTKGGHADALPIAPPLAPFLVAAMASPGELLFPWPDGRMRTNEADPQKVLRSALARAGLVLGYEHTCRRCRARGTPHVEQHQDAAQRRCPECGMLLWPRAIPRPLRFHDLRHTTATLLLRAGVDPHRVQRIMRHRDVRTTLGTYGHLDVEDLRAAVATLPGNEPAVTGKAARAPAATGFVTRLLPVHGKRKKREPEARNSPATSGSYMEREKGFELIRGVNCNHAKVFHFLQIRLIACPLTRLQYPPPLSSQFP